MCEKYNWSHEALNCVSVLETLISIVKKKMFGEKLYTARNVYADFFVLFQNLQIWSVILWYKTLWYSSAD